MVNKNSVNNNNQPADYASSEPVLQSNESEPPGKVLRIMVIGISLVILITLIAFFVGFISGWYGLYALGLISLVVIPFVLIGGAIFTFIKRKWVLLSLGLIILPASWIITLIGCMSDPPFDPADLSAHMIHAAVLVSGAFASWLFLTLIFWPRR